MFFKENGQYRCAVYLRLSRSDGDQQESNSIKNQRALLNDYLGKHPELYKVDEYVDDGYSGTNFERPDFKRMMQDIEKRNVNCIIVKDLSRFGRNYIETGRYLERIFPFMGITVRCMDIEDLEKQAEAIRVEQIKLYESYADGVLLRDAYIEKKKVLSEKLAALQDSIRTEKEEQECADELDEEIRALTKQASEKTYIGGLTKECVEAFVSMVYLYDDQTMKIEFNCEDVIRRALEKYGT